MGDRYIRRGTSKFYFATAVVALGAPTAAEITAAVDLTPEVADWSGFTLENQEVTTPNLLESFDPKIPGVDQTGTPSMTLYERKAEQTLWDAVAKGTSGFLIFMPEGNAATFPTEVWPVRVASRYRNPNAAANEAASYVAQFSVTATPNTDGARGA